MMRLNPKEMRTGTGNKTENAQMKKGMNKMKNMINIITKAIAIIAIAIIMTAPVKAEAATYYLDGNALDEYEGAKLNEEADVRFANRPLNVTSKFKADGWEYVLIESGDIARACHISGGWLIDGIADHETEKIYIDASPECVDVLYHEMGHFIDNNGSTGGTSSQTAEFTQIFAEEGKSLGPYGAESPDEFFAEVVMNMYVDPTGTQMKCPKAYQYVAAAIRSF